MGRLIIAFCLLLSLRSGAADTTLQLRLVKTIPGQFSDVYVDNLQNIYVISTSTSRFKKLNSNGDSVAVFNSVVRYGNIYSADVTNPLKILLFYKQFSTILILDRFLSVRAQMDVRKLGITQVKAIAQSYDSNMWLYDEGDGKLKKIDENNTVLFESADLRLVFDESLSPDQIIDNNGQLYLYDKQLGWLIFDYYGGFKKRFSFTGWRNVSVNDNKLLGRDDAHVFLAAQTDIDYHTMSADIPWQAVVKTVWLQNRMYVLTKDGLNIYQLTY